MISKLRKIIFSEIFLYLLQEELLSNIVHRSICTGKGTASLLHTRNFRTGHWNRKCHMNEQLRSRLLFHHSEHRLDQGRIQGCSKLQEKTSIIFNRTSYLKVKSNLIFLNNINFCCDPRQIRQINLGVTICKE